MSAQVDERLLLNVNEYLSRNVGLNFSPGRFEDLSRGLKQACNELNYDEPALCIADILSGKLSEDELQVIVRNLTIGETYFFRDPETFGWFESTILPQLIERRKNTVRHLRLWSAGCSTGEEPYSMAISLAQQVPDLSRWHLTLMATDINKLSLQSAKNGQYKPWSFRSTPRTLVEKYFVPGAEELQEVAPHIKRLVSFTYHNLAASPFLTAGSNLSNMDVIFCRNVLIYFTRARCQQIVSELAESLVPGGWLIMGRNDSSQILGSLPRNLRQLNSNVFQRIERAYDE